MYRIMVVYRTVFKTHTPNYVTELAASMPIYYTREEAEKEATLRNLRNVDSHAHYVARPDEEYFSPFRYDH